MAAIDFLALVTYSQQINVPAGRGTAQESTIRHSNYELIDAWNFTQVKGNANEPKPYVTIQDNGGRTVVENIPISQFEISSGIAVSDRWYRQPLDPTGGLQITLHFPTPPTNEVAYAFTYRLKRQAEQTR